MLKHADIIVDKRTDRQVSEGEPARTGTEGGFHQTYEEVTINSINVCN
jgi:hypothetical protein